MSYIGWLPPNSSKQRGYVQIRPNKGDKPGYCCGLSPFLIYFYFSELGVVDRQGVSSLFAGSCVGLGLDMEFCWVLRQGLRGCNGKDEIRGLATAQWTMELSIAAVEMTAVWVGWRKTSNDKGGLGGRAYIPTHRKGRDGWGTRAFGAGREGR